LTRRVESFIHCAHKTGSPWCPRSWINHLRNREETDMSIKGGEPKKKSTKKKAAPKKAAKKKAAKKR